MILQSLKSAFLLYAIAAVIAFLVVAVIKLLIVVVRRFAGAGENKG